MAGYQFTVTGPTTRTIGTVRHHTWTIEESVDTSGAIAATDEWTIPALPTPCEITLVEAHLETGGGASTIRPALGLKSSFVLSSITGGGIDQVGTAAAYIREQVAMRVPGMPAGTGLVGRSTVDTSTDETGVIKTRITVREGHSA